MPARRSPGGAAGAADVPPAEYVKQFWERHPVAAAGIAAERGSRAFFEAYDRLRARTEPPGFAARFHQYDRCAGLRVADIGCGNGHVLQRYAQGGAAVTGVDLTRTALDLTRRRFQLYGLTPPALVEASAEALPFPADYFDAVSSMGVVHHTPDDAGAIRELIRVLRPGGRLMVMVYHRDSALYRLTFPAVGRFSRSLRGWDAQRLVKLIDGPGNPLGRVYSRRQLAGLLTGCDVVEMTAGCLRGTLPPLGPLPDPVALLPHAVERPLTRRFGWFLYAAAVKRSAGSGRAPAGIMHRQYC